jgi:anti-anti-sigma factor
MTTTANISHLNGAAVSYRGAHVRADIDTDLTVITISGEIDASNVDDVARHARGLVPDSGALIVDLADIDFIAIEGLRALFALNVECARADTTWALITGHAANRLLAAGDNDKLLPAVGSATEALQLVRRSGRGNRSPLLRNGSTSRTGPMPTAPARNPTPITENEGIRE